MDLPDILRLVLSHPIGLAIRTTQPKALRQDAARWLLSRGLSSTLIIVMQSPAADDEFFLFSHAPQAPAAAPPRDQNGDLLSDAPGE